MPDPHSESGTPKREPAIRTMRSDVAEFLERHRPSLVGLAARQAELERSPHALPRRRGMKFVIALMTLAVVAGGGYAGYRWLAGRFQPPPIPAPQPLPAPFIAYDAAIEFTVAKTDLGLAGIFRDAAAREDRPGIFRRLLVLTPDAAGGSPQPPNTAELMTALGASPPSGFLESADDAPQLFSYRQASGARFGIMFKARNAARLLQGLHDWEPTLTPDLAPLFPGETVRAGDNGFRDVTYRNIDYRFLAFDQDRDLGIGYLHFPARRLIVMATSEEALQKSIERLYGR
ncbi:MAG: hypothetical protein A3B37_01420 [Candidatus Sungbacteria bacterium RIFCSPLOWO2_01_FULL_59_16]|uniref:DUF3352 domain-containing protein n=1 Tax=Candidatus Sungbacteria bacterium RIFCSPLOWO2_01_FULL_59_16 TaxID=1802280 RepID=A0A1G2LCB1_9BACT|nr:MAG: hypothetical protein A3B37_01420 [Candidatus Sungbacteria bacterium RIFCSPLOWO2_01_FULL_59_16]